MGIVFSLDLDWEEWEKQCNAWKKEGIFGESQRKEPTRPKSLQTSLPELIRHPEMVDEFPNLLLGYSNGMTGEVLLEILSHLQPASNGEWIFSSINNESVGYFELVLVTLSWMKEYGFGEEVGRPSLLALGLTVIAVRASENLLKRKESASKPAKTSNPPESLSAEMNENLPAEEQASKRLSASYQDYRNSLVKSKKISTSWDNRGKTELLAIMKQLQALAFQFAKQGEIFYRPMGVILGIQVRRRLDLLDISPKQTYNIAAALVDLILPRPKHFEMDRFSPAFAPQPPKSFNKFRLLSSEYQENACPFFCRMFEVRVTKDEKEGAKVLRHLSSGNEKFTREEFYDIFKMPPLRGRSYTFEADIEAILEMWEDEEPYDRFCALDWFNNDAIKHINQFN